MKEKHIFVVFLLTISLFNASIGYGNEFKFGFWNSTNKPSQLSTMQAKGTSHSVTYHYMNYSWNWGKPEIQKALDYLDEAQSRGIKVVLQVHDVVYDNGILVPAHLNDTIALVNACYNHPALYGWYIADEPLAKCSNSAARDYVGLENQLRSVYNTIKTYDLSTPKKPVFMVFCQIYNDIPGLNDPSRSFDIMLWDNYPNQYGLGYQEFDAQPTENGETRWETFDKYAAKAVSQKIACGADELWYVGPASKWGYSSRLVTLDEHRFLCFLPFARSGFEGYQGWAYYKNEDYPDAQPNEAYPDSSSAWLDDVWYPVSSIFAEAGPAIAAGPVNNVLSINNTNIVGSVYSIQENGVGYLYISNRKNTSQVNVETTFNLPDKDVIYLEDLGESTDAVPIDNNVFTNNYPEWSAHCYRIGSSILANATFSDSAIGTSPWLPASASIRWTPAKRPGGTPGSMSVEYRASPNSHAKQYVTNSLSSLGPGSYRVTLWIYISSTNLEKVGLQFLTDDNGTIKYTSSWTDDLSQGWHKISGEFELNWSSLNSAYFYIRTLRYSDRFYLDDIELYKIN